MGTGVGVTVGAGVSVRVAVADSGGVGGAVVAEGCSTCTGTGVGALQAVSNSIPIKVVRSLFFLFMIEL